MNRTALIFSGGDVVSKHRFDFIKNPYVICADSGYDNAIASGFEPDIVIGDFDSLKNNIKCDVKTITLPTHKDNTDTQACIEYLLEKGYKTAYLTCAFGGRIDHTMANIALIAYGINRGLEITVIDNDFYMLPIRDEKEITGTPGDIFSVFPIGGDCSGVVEEGFEYEVSDGILRYDTPMGISNVLMKENAKVKVEKGILIAVHYK